MNLKAELRTIAQELVGQCRKAGCGDWATTDIARIAFLESLSPDRNCLPGGVLDAPGAIRAALGRWDSGDHSRVMEYWIKTVVDLAEGDGSLVIGGAR